MKKSFLAVAFTALIATFFGCSNLLETNTASGSAVSKMPLQISLKTDSARYIAAVADWSLENITNWTVKFTEETAKATEIGYWDAENYSTDHEEKATIKVEYDETNKVFGMSKVATGTYTLEITGTPAQGGYTVYGKLTGFEIDANDKNSKSMIVDLKKNGTGSLLLSFASGGDLSLSTSLVGGIEAVLTPLKKNSDAKELTFKLSSEETAEFYYKNDSATENNGNLTLNVASLSSGMYLLSFIDSTSMKGKYSVSSDCQIVEIADGVTTMEDVNLYYGTQKNYYATNNSSDIAHNGLSSSSPKEINTLLKALKSDFDDYSCVNIYMNSEPPVLSVSAVKELQDVLDEKQQYIEISVYKNAGDAEPVFMLENTANDSDSYKATTSIKDDVTVKAEADNDNSALTVTSIECTDESGVNLKLVDGASVTVKGTFRPDLLHLTAVTSNGEDNLSSYDKTPLLTVNSTFDTDLVEISSESYKARFDTTGSDADSVTSVYAQLVGSGNVSITTFDATASLKANYASLTDTVYSTSAVIPYKTDSDSLVFTLEGVDTTISAYSWLLNGKEVGSNETLSFVPSESNYINLDETNTVSLHVKIDDQWYYTEFTFTFSSTDYSRAVYSGCEGSSGSYTYNLYEIEYTSSTNPTSILKIDYSTADLTEYTIDDEQNLWIVQKTKSTTNTYNLHLIKQSKLVSTSSFKKNESSNNVSEYDFTDITLTNTTYLDIAYDNKNDMLYVLATDETYNETNEATYTSKVYAFYPSKLATTTTTDMYYSVTIPTSYYQTALNTVLNTLSSLGVNMDFVFTKLAVYNNTVYMADNSYNVFKLANFTKDTATTITPIWVANLQAQLGIKNSTTSEDETNTDATDALTLTDIQIGDGFGNDTDTLYVLMRQHTSGQIASGNNNTYYSRGALFKITGEGTSATFAYYGYDGTTNTTDTNGDTTNTYYIPSSNNTNNNFFGPCHFVALVPKKLVIADDGFYYTEVADTEETTNNDTITNKDGIYTFDMNSATLTRTSANIKISVPSVSGTDLELKE